MKTSRLFWTTAILGILTAAHATFWDGGWIAGTAGRVFAPVSVSIRGVLTLIDVAFSSDNLVTENLRLKDELTHTQAAAARATDMTDEVAFLRAAVGLHERVPGSLIEASAFSYLRAGGVRQMTINRGSRDGVQVGYVVVTAPGALVGRVIEIFPTYAMVRTVGDPSLEVTARILASDTTGLVRMDSARGLILDLVQKSEIVTEGQTIVTSGNDQFPPGLVVGTVRSVDTSSTTLFTIVRMESSIDERFQGRVLVIP